MHDARQAWLLDTLVLELDTLPNHHARRLITLQDSIKKLWTLVRNSHIPKKLVIIVLILSLIETAAALAVPLFTMKLINGFSEGGFTWDMAAYVGLVLVFQAIVSGLSFYLLRKLGERIVANLRQYIWRHVLYLKVPYFDAHESGETMSRITQDTSVIKELITNQFVSFISGIFAIVGAVAILLWIDWKMTLLMLIAVPVAILVTIPLGQRMHKISKANQDELASFSGHLGRVLTNIRLVKTSQTEPLEQQKGNAKIQQLYEYGLKEAKIMAMLSPIMTLIMMVVLILLFGYGGSQVATGAITAGELVAIIIYLIQIIIPFTQMATFFTALQKALGATERVQEIVQQPVEIMEGAAIQQSSAAITFDDVVFQYHERPILKGVSFTIPEGKTTAFVSSSGGGKTTMFSLLARFYDVKDGEIRFGQQPIHDLSITQWRSLFGYVAQDAPLMNGTIRENVRYGKQDATEEEVRTALEAAYAWSFVSQLEQGLDTEVGEGGIKLSGGQKQRIAIARALLRNPKILLLDEATSNLDNDSEREVQRALESLMKDRTTIVIAHRLSTITNADQIILFEDGRVARIGSADMIEELMKSYDLK